MCDYRKHWNTKGSKEINTACIQAVAFSLISVSHLWISSVHLWPYSQPGHLVPPPTLTFSSTTPHSLSLWRTMMWTWMWRRRWERYSWERPRRALGGRTVAIMATVTSREEEEAAWWTAAVGPRSSRISSHHRQKTVTAKGEPDCPASLWVHRLPLLCVQATQALNSSLRVLTSSFKPKKSQRKSRFLQILHWLQDDYIKQFAYSTCSLRL